MGCRAFISANDERGIGFLSFKDVSWDVPPQTSSP